MSVSWIFGLMMTNASNPPPPAAPKMEGPINKNGRFGTVVDVPGRRDVFFFLSLSLSLSIFVSSFRVEKGNQDGAPAAPRNPNDNINKNNGKQ